MKEKNHQDLLSLYRAILSLKDEDEVARFLADLCTPGEISAFSERWAIARMLHQGDDGYREISAATGASTTTVARVARFLKQESYQGYLIALGRMRENKK